MIYVLEDSRCRLRSDVILVVNREDQNEWSGSRDKKLFLRIFRVTEKKIIKKIIFRNL